MGIILWQTSPGKVGGLVGRLPRPAAGRGEFTHAWVDLPGLPTDLTEGRMDSVGGGLKRESLALTELPAFSLPSDWVC